MIWWPGAEGSATATAGVHDAPFLEVDMTIFASPSDGSGWTVENPRSAHAMYRRLWSSKAIVGYAFVRNDSSSASVRWSNCDSSATSTSSFDLRCSRIRPMSRPSFFPRGMRLATFGPSKLRPSVTERATIIASCALWPERVNRRHATYTVPVVGSIAIVAPWLRVPSLLVTRRGVSHVTPQSRDAVKKMSDLSVGPSPVNALYATYTAPAGSRCTIGGAPASMPGVWMRHVPPTPRGMSTAIHGLSSNRPVVPGSVATILVPRYAKVSPFSRLLLSMNRDTNTPLAPFAPRLKARPAKYTSPFVPARTTASAAAP